MEQRNEPTTAEIVKALREADEYSGMPGYCGTVEDVAADRLEQLERERVRITDELTAMTARAEKAEAEAKERGERAFKADARVLLLEAQVSDEQELRKRAEAEAENAHQRGYEEDMDEARHQYEEDGYV